eukprot:m.120298 g.120298  ORF g.120298 m.120298 type:complete len:101 (-) comp28799_c0_seq5:1660-1962(-)
MDEQQYLKKFGRLPLKGVATRALKGGKERTFYDSAEHALGRKNGKIVPNIANLPRKRSMAPNPLNPDVTLKSPVPRPIVPAVEDETAKDNAGDSNDDTSK